MRKLLKLLGAGFISGATARFGCMVIEALFPRGIGGFLARLMPRDDDEPEEEEERRTRKKKRLRWI